MDNEHQARFDAVLRRMATMKPMSVKQLSAKLKADKAAKAKAKKASFQKMEK